MLSFLGGGAGLIQHVVNNATVPVIETGAGICHLYIDQEADLEMAVEVAVNAKISRPQFVMRLKLF